MEDHTDAKGINMMRKRQIQDLVTQDEIIEMTRQAGGFDATPEFLKRFAKLVAAKEREACAKVCEGRIGGAVLDDQWMLGFKAAMRQCAEAIRARGQA
jgi:hypothetical protein